MGLLACCCVWLACCVVLLQGADRLSFAQRLSPSLGSVAAVSNSYEDEGYVPVTMSTASLAYVGGYVVKILEKETSCIDCIQEMSVASCSSPLLRLIRNQDQGSLKYPSKSLIYILCVIQEFSEYCFKYAPNKGVYKVIMGKAFEKLDEVFVKLCSKPNHSKMLAKLVCENFIKAVIENIARKHSDKFENIRKLNVKPTNRKLLKFS